MDKEHVVIHTCNCGRWYFNPFNSTWMSKIKDCEAGWHFADGKSFADGGTPIPICLGCGEKLSPNPLNTCTCNDLHGKRRGWELLYCKDGSGDKYWYNGSHKLREGDECDDCGRAAPPTPNYCLCELDGGVVECDGEVAVIAAPEPFMVEEYDPPLCPFCGRDLSHIPKEQWG